MRRAVPTGPVPSNRTFHGAVDIGDNKMLIWGGGQVVDFSFVPSTDAMWIYNKNTQTWNQKNPQGPVQPSGRLGHGMARKGNKVFMFGGIVPKSNGECCDFLNDMYEYNIDTNRWRQLSPSGVIPSPRGHMGFIRLDGNIWLQGGEGTDFNIQKGLWRYNIDMDQWLLINEVVPVDVNQRESQLFNRLGDSKLFSFGGDTEGPDFYNLLNDTQVYRIQQDDWNNKNTPVRPPTAKRMPSASFGNSNNAQVYLFGGNTAFDVNTGAETDHNQVWYWS
jgi:N-acetylneuraminic acid mutarotase